MSKNSCVKAGVSLLALTCASQEGDAALLNWVPLSKSVTRMKLYWNTPCSSDKRLAAGAAAGILLEAVLATVLLVLPVVMLPLLALLLVLLLAGAEFALSSSFLIIPVPQKSAGSGAESRSSIVSAHSKRS